MTDPNNTHYSGIGSPDPDDHNPNYGPNQEVDNVTFLHHSPRLDSAANADQIPTQGPDYAVDSGPDDEPDSVVDSVPDSPTDDDEAIEGEWVDADHDGLPDTSHADRLEVDPDDPDEPERLPVVAVDNPAATSRRALPELATGKEVATRPIVAPWLRDHAQRVAVAKWAVRRAAHVSGYHAARTPLYTGKLLAQAPRGLGKLTAETTRWVLDRESAPLRKGASDGGDADTYMRLSHQRNDRVKHRLITLFAVILPAILAAAVVWAVLPVLAKLVALLVIGCVFGLIGRRPDRPVIGRAVVNQGAEKLTSDVVVRGLGSLGIGGINSAIAKKSGISFPSPITRDGPGFRAEVDLPHGVTADEVIERRKKLASGLRRPLGCVWPESDRTVHEGRLVLFVGDEDMNKAKQPAWPLDRADRVDLFKPQPFGTDQRGKWVNVTLMFIAGVCGAIPRMGKTVTMRLWLLIACMDPRARVHAYDLKGTGDFSALSPVLHRYGVGDDLEDIEAMLTDMRDVREELRRRAKVIRNLPADVCPDNKVTPALAGRKSLGLHPVVIGVDECQVWFEHPKHGAEFDEICTDLVKRGPALGIVLLLATQRPDAKAIPTGIGANASMRYCLKVGGQVENDMVLGTSAYKNGVRATTFAWADKGIGYFVGEGADARIVKSVYKDAPATKKLVAKIRATREALGLLTGYAAGETPDATRVSGPRVDVLGDVAAVFAGAEKLWSTVILARLGELRPEFYGTWTPKVLADALKPYGLAAGQVWDEDSDGKGRNRNGYTANAVHAALAERGDDPG